MNEKENKNKMPRFNMNWIYGIIIVILVYLFFTGTGGSTSKTVDYTQFEQYVKSGYASKIIAQKDKGVLEMYVSKEHLKDVFGTDDFKKIGTVPMVTVEYASNEKLMDLVDEARANNNFKGNLRFEQSNDFMSNIFWNFFPLLFIIAIWVFIMRRMGGGSPTGGSVFNVGKSKAKLIEKGEATRVFPITPGRIIFEVEGVSYEIAKEALRLAAQKLPVTTKFIVRRDYDKNA